MLEILIGTIAGIISGTGMGGGTILIFLLTYICGIGQHVAQATNLIYFIPTSIIVIIVNIRNKNINFKLANIIIIFGIIGAIIGSSISINTDVKILKKCFAIFLLIIGIHEIYTILKEYKNIKNR